MPKVAEKENSDYPISVIFLNGPPRSGKDSIAKSMRNAYPYIFTEFKMSETLKRGSHTLLGLDSNPHGYELVKDRPTMDFFGMTPREFYIWLAEECVKKKFGKNAFGIIAARLMLRELSYKQFEKIDREGRDFCNRIFVVSDCGFYDEMTPIVNCVGVERCLMLHVHREGCDFSNDSRSYVYYGGMRTWVYRNVEHNLGLGVGALLQSLKKIGVAGLDKH